MMKRAILGVVVMVGLGLAWGGGARAQAAESPRAIQGLISSGQDQQALAALGQVLAAHPDSGVAWYLSAEAQDAVGNETAARGALAKAEQFAPGLPFAKPADVAALRAHLAGKGGVSPLVWLVGVVVLFFMFRRFFRRRAVYAGGGYQAGYGQPGGGYGSGMAGQGSGLGGSLLSGLAAGAGFAVGERVIDDLTGNRGGDGFFGDGANAAPLPPDRDDGLQGSPGWDDGSDPNGGGGGFDPGNNW